MHSRHDTTRKAVKKRWPWVTGIADTAEAGPPIPQDRSHHPRPAPRPACPQRGARPRPPRTASSAPGRRAARPSEQQRSFAQFVRGRGVDSDVTAVLGDPSESVGRRAWGRRPEPGDSDSPVYRRRLG